MTENDVAQALMPLIEETIAEQVNTFAKEPVPSVLYHYTDGPGLIGILESQSLWATSIDFLNDPNEVSYGTKLIADEIEKMNRSEDPYFLSLSFMMDFVEKDRKSNENLFTNRYVISFCEKAEVLSQWRAYGKNGTGYCIGFAFEGGTSIGTHPDEILGDHFADYGRPRQILYDGDMQREIMRASMLKIQKLATDRLKEYSIDPSSDFAFRVYSSIGRKIVIELLPLIKKPEFHEEREWRILAHHNPTISNLRFRTSRNIVTPYLKTGFYIDRGGETLPAEVPVAEILVGQALNYGRAFVGLKHLASSHGYDKTEIKRSTIEFV